MTAHVFLQYINILMYLKLEMWQRFGPLNLPGKCNETVI